MFLLGLCYGPGHGCEADEETGAILMTRASKKGAGIVEKAGMVLGKRFGRRLRFITGPSRSR